MQRSFLRMWLKVKWWREQRVVEHALRSASPPVPPDELRGKLLAELPPNLVEQPARSQLLVGGLRWSTGVAVVFALGAVWWWRASEPSAIAQALKEFGEARTLHLVVISQYKGLPLPREEIWTAGKDRIRRVKTWTEKGKRYQEIIVRNGDREWRYRTMFKEVVELTDGVIHPALESTFGGVCETALHPKRFVEEVWKVAQEAGMTLHQENSVDKNGRALRSYTWKDQRTGETLRLVLDPERNRLIAFETEGPMGGGWRTDRFDQIEYDVPIPDERFRFVPPQGTTLVEFTWWKNRCHQVLAKGASGKWRLTIHALDVADNGDVCYLSVSRERLTDEGYDGGVQPLGRLIDDQGQPYAELYGDSRHYMGPEFNMREQWTLTLIPVERRRKPKPRTFTVEINVYAPGATAETALKEPGLLVFKNLSANYLPPGVGVWGVGPDAFGVTAAARRQAIERYRKAFGK